MKKTLYYITILLACLFTTACEDDRNENPVLRIPQSFVLNAPTEVSEYYDLKNMESLTVSCERPDYGFNAVTTYTAELALDESFAQPYALPTRYTATTLQLNASEMAIAVCTLLVNKYNYDDTTYPQDEITTVYLRLKADLSVDGIESIYSSTLPLNVKSYFALEPLSMPEQMFLTGNVIGNWDWQASVQMIPVHSQPGKFWCMQYLGKTSEGEMAQIKFNTLQDDDTAIGANAQIDEATQELANTTIANNGSIEIGTPGWYIVAVTTEIMGRQFIYHLQLLKPEIYLHGGVTNNANWGIPDRAYLFDIPTDADGEFVSPPFANDSQLRMCVVLSDGEWEWYKSEFNIIGGKIVYRGNGGEQEAVNVKQGQRAYLKFADNTGYVQ